SAAGPHVRHVFRKPRQYWGKCRAQLEGRNRNYHGLGVVGAPKPPSVRRVSRESARVVTVTFSDEIDPSAAEIKLTRKGQELPAETTLSHDDRGLTLTSPMDLPRDVRLSLDGIRDRAAKPNVMQSAMLPVPINEWPPTREGLLAAWADHFEH